MSERFRKKNYVVQLKVAKCIYYSKNSNLIFQHVFRVVRLRKFRNQRENRSTCASRENPSVALRTRRHNKANSDSLLMAYYIVTFLASSWLYSW